MYKHNFNQKNQTNINIKITTNKNKSGLGFMDEVNDNNEQSNFGISNSNKVISKSKL